MTSGSPEDRRSGPGNRGLLPWIAAVSGLVTALWVAAALMMAGRGFDVTDEGFYVLSYRWWDSTPRVFTGVQYLYGPVFGLLGWSIPGLRVVRVLDRRASVLLGAQPRRAQVRRQPRGGTEAAWRSRLDRYGRRRHCG